MITQPSEVNNNKNTSEIISTQVNTNNKEKTQLRKCLTVIPETFNFENNQSINQQSEKPINKCQSHSKLNEASIVYSPKIRPKVIKVFVSPMRLKNQFMNNNESDHYCSGNESEKQKEQINEEHKSSIIRNIRKQMGKIKDICHKEECKEYNHDNINRLSLQDNKPITAFTKTIKGFLEDEKAILNTKGSLRMSYGPYIQPKTFSLLDVLEYTVYETQLELSKSKSTLI